jgi:hypothetical protein
MNWGHRPNWNAGTMEYWNDGFKENVIQSAYFCINFHILMQHYVWQK